MEKQLTVVDPVTGQSRQLTRLEIADAITRLQPRRQVEAGQTIKVAFLDIPPDYATGSLETYWAKYFPQVNRSNASPEWVQYIQNEYRDAKLIQDGFASIPVEQRQAIFNQAIKAWQSTYANVTFELVSDPAQADVRVGLSGNVNMNFSPGSLPDRPRLGDVFLNTSMSALAQGLTADQALSAMFHEFGHVLGLSHPTLDGPLPSEYGKQQYAAMSYGTILGGFLPMTPMLFDALGLEAIGLLKENVNVGDGSVYSFSNADQGKLLIDNGGEHDKIDASATTTDNEIDLRATDFNTGKAYFSSIGVGAGKYNVAIYEGSQIEDATGGKGKDHIIGNDVGNVLNGGNGDGRADVLEGGKGSDIYIFNGAFGKDTVRDSDGSGSIQIDGVTLSGTARASGRSGSGEWVLKQGGSTYRLKLRAAANGTESQLVITKDGDTKNSVVIEKFNLASALENPYLGIKLAKSTVVAMEGTGANPLEDPDFDPASVAGSSIVQEGAGKTVSFYLGRPARAGETLTLSLSELAGKFQVVLGDSTVPIGDAIIVLKEGQTSVSVALIQVGDVDEDGSGNLTATLHGLDGDVTSNAWGIELRDGGDAVKTFNGDQRALISGIEADFNVHPGDPAFNTYNWGATQWAVDGTLVGGIVEEDFNDVIYGSDGKDRMNGLGGNDALDGRAGDDVLDGGVGDDLLAGGAGSDTIRGGAGKDVILSATGLSVFARQPDDEWAPPGGATTWIQGSNWGVYSSGGSGRTIEGGGSIFMDTAGDFVDAGDGDDIVIAGRGNDHIQGGDGDDALWGHGGDDVVLGGDGADALNGDGIKDSGYYQTVADAEHGNDFLDGGAGDDDITGGGANDVLYGGLGADLLWGDTRSEDELTGEFHGEDYLDGEAGDDQLVGGGKDDVLFGGVGNDNLWGDNDSEDKLAGEFHGDDYLDGEDGNDQLIGGGGNDTLLGGAGADVMLGDDDASQLEGKFHGADYLDGEDGDDELTGGGSDDTLLGGAGDDSLLGDSYNETDLASEFHGDDYLDGGAGDDQLVGGGKDDVLYGGAGKDRMWGDHDSSEKLAGAAHGNDYLDGGADDDLLFGGGKDDTLIGGDGADELVGDLVEAQLAGEFHGDDTLDGGEGNDRLFGLGKDDTLLGGAGNDLLMGDGQVSELAAQFHGDDYLDGGDGNDALFGGGGDDVLIGGAGDDFLSGEDQQSTFSTTTLTGNDALYGGDGNDTLVAGAGNNYLSGDEGDDYLWGGAGDDVLLGGSGNDFIRSGAGNDTLNGGEGADFYYVALGSGAKHISDVDDGSNNVLVLEGGFNFGLVRLSLGSLVIGDATGTTEIHLDGVDYDDLAGTSPVQEIRFSDGVTMSIAQLLDAVPIDIPTTEFADVVRGTSGREVIHALAGDDVVDGRGGNDSLDLGEGNDIGRGGDGDDLVLGAGGNDQLYGDAGKDRLEGGTGDDLLDGGSGDDNLLGGSGDDALLGAAGNDELLGGDGVDTLDGGDGNDDLDGGAGNDVLEGGAGDDVLLGGIGADQLNGGGGADRLDGGQGADAMTGGAGDDEYHVDDADDTVSESQGEGRDVVFTGIDYVLAENIEDLRILQGSQATHATGNAADNTIVGNNILGSTLLGMAGNDIIDGGAGNDLLDGGEGADILAGAAGDDEYHVDDVGDQVNEAFASGTDSVFATVDHALWSNVENLTLVGPTALEGTGNGLANVITGNASDNTLRGEGGDDTLVGGTGNDILDGGSGSDVLDGGDGDDVYLVDNAQDVIVEAAGGGTDTVQSAVSYVLGADLENLTLVGQDARNGTGNAGDNVILGNEYENRLDGGGGEDRLEGGGGDDTYVIDSAGDVVVELEGEGYDTVEIGRSFSVSEIANIENVTLTGTLNINATGDDGTNILIGNAGDNVLDGGLGQDIMQGGAGNDTYIVDADDNWVIESPDEGIDTIVRNFDTTYILEANVENLTLAGSVYRGNGNELDNVITGNDADNNLLGLGGNDTLIGGGGDDALFGSEGQDVLIGGTGDDYYEIDDAGDTIVENAGEGDDFVRSSISWTLGANVERLALDGTDDLSATGNGLANGLWGNDGSNVLTGGQGNDFLSGGAGDDVYVFNAGDGQDTIDNTDALDSVDTLRFGMGIGENDVLAFQSGSHIFFKIKGTSDQIAFLDYYGANTQSGGVTMDHKIDRVEFANGTVWDQAMIQTVVDRANNNHAPTVNSNLPTLRASQGNLFTYVVPLNTITDPDAWDSVIYSATMPNGDPLPSWLSFNAQTRTFSGTPTSANVGSLQFVLWGTDNYGSGTGFYVNLSVTPPNQSPVIATPLADQSVAEGTAINYTIPSGSFSDPDAGDSLSYVATLADGSALPSWLSFNASTRKFTGTVPIGALDSLSVRVTATDQGGLAVQDVFNIAVTVQNLTLNGTTSAETLTGRSGNDTIDGKAGNDTLIGNAGNDRLIGGTGNDTMSGGTGDDTYVVDSTSDIVNENAGEGVDTVESSVTWTLGANVERLTLTGTTAINGTGNALDNVLTGNSAANTLTGNAGNDVLDGLGGADTMKGGTGDDTYYVDNASDVVTELASEGTDTVVSTLTHTLAANVENLRLNATGAINGTGNTLDNILFAGAGNNTLNGLGGTDTASYLYAGSAVTVSLAVTSAQATGGSGSDTLQNIENLTGSAFNDTLTGSAAANVLDGGAGNDTLTGGAGNDTYRMGRGQGSDTIVENDTTAGNSDTALFGSDIAANQLWFRQVGNNLEVSVIGSSDQFTLNNWYLGSQYHVEQFRTSDGRVLSDSNVQNLVQAMASFSPPAAGQTTLPPNYQSSLNAVIAANWQ